MKHKFFSFALMALAMSFTFSACGDDAKDEKNDDDSGVVVPDGNDEKDDESGKKDDETDVNVADISSKEQKEVLEQTAMNLLDKINANDFKQLTDVVEYYKENIAYKRHYSYSSYSYEYTGVDTEAIEDWFETAVKACEGDMSNNVQKNLYIAANFKGRFVAGKTAWEYKGASDGLEFQFTDQNGKTCTLKIVASDIYKKVHFSGLDEKKWQWDGNREVQRRYENSFGVPETVNVTFTQGSSTLVSAKVTTSLTISGTDVDLGKDSYEVTANVDVLGYKFVIEKVQYTQGQKAYVSMKVLKNSETLITLKAEANGKVQMAGDNVELRESGRVAINIDVLGKVQAIGEIKDLDKEINFCDAAKDAETENEIQTAVSNANDLLNVGLYYDGKSKRQAFVKWNYTSYRSRYGYEYYELEPAIYFNDDTSYSFGDYFDKTYFKKVIDKFNYLISDFEDLVD